MAFVNLVCLVAVVGVVLEVGSLPTGVKYPTGKRIQIPSSFAKSYWVGGSAFTRDNFKGLPLSFYTPEPKCTNLTPDTKKSLISKTESGTGSVADCVLLYKAKNCEGAYIMGHHLEDAIPDIFRAEDIASVKACPPLNDAWRGQEGQAEVRTPILEYVDPTQYEELLEAASDPREEDAPFYKTMDLGGRSS